MLADTWQAAYKDERPCLLVPVKFLGILCPESRWVGKGFLMEPLIIPSCAYPRASLILHIDELLFWVLLLQTLTRF